MNSVKKTLSVAMDTAMETVRTTLSVAMGTAMEAVEADTGSAVMAESTSGVMDTDMESAETTTTSVVMADISEKHAVNGGGGDGRGRSGGGGGGGGRGIVTMQSKSSIKKPQSTGAIPVYKKKKVLLSEAQENVFVGLLRWNNPGRRQNVLFMTDIKDRAEKAWLPEIATSAIKGLVAKHFGGLKLNKPSMKVPGEASVRFCGFKGLQFVDESGGETTGQTRVGAMVP